MKTKLDLAQARLIGSTISQLRRVQRIFSRSVAVCAAPAAARTASRPRCGWVFDHSRAPRYAALLLYALALGLASSFAFAAAVPDAADIAKTSIPWSQIGAKAGADYQGDGLAVIPTPRGAGLRCVFQRLEGEATREGLWLTSTVTNAASDRFRVVAADVRRLTSTRNSKTETQIEVQSLLTSAATDHGALPRTGTVKVADKLVRFLRPGVIEEYTVSMDGVRQDFIIEHPPLNSQPRKGAWPPRGFTPSTLNQRAGELAVRLAVSGASVEPAAGGVRLVLGNSGRKIAYSRLRVTDATGKELSARMEVASGILPDVEGAHPAARNLAADFSTASLQDTAESAGLEAPALRQAEMPDATSLVVLVNDADAVYPIRIDPTFSDANWISMGGVNGANSDVTAAVVDGSGNLYIGGSFTLVGDVLANYICKWNGNSWSALGSDLNGPVYALVVSYTNVYAGGSFTTAGGNAANYIAKWNGSSWSALGSGIGGVIEPNVYALAVAGSDLYAGGIFETAGESAAINIAKWNGNSWSALGSGVSGPHAYPYNGGPVAALAVSGSNVYAGGSFTTAGGNAANSIAKWDGSSWSALGSGMNSYGFVYALAVSGSDVYVGGSFSTAGGSAANHIAKWNGSSWSALGSGMNNSVYAVAISGSDLYAGGYFTTAGGSVATNIAKWNGSSWSAPGSGMNSTVYALAVSGSNVYAGGYFTTAGGSAANYVAKWNGSIWSTLGSGLNGRVWALAVSGSNLYAGGDFAAAGTASANYVAKRNGSTWSALGSGMNSIVWALTVSGSDVYAGGEFTVAGGSAAKRIAKWNGSSWNALGSGMNGIVSALAASGSDLYAGGVFTTADGSAASRIAKWNGSSWSGLGSGMNGEVLALAVSDTNVYAGGRFTATGDGTTQLNYIAKWNGSSWNALGSGMNDIVRALAVSGSNVYAGGEFTTAGGSAATNIAKWNGSGWSALGSGMNGYVYALAVSGSDLYGSGTFTTVDGSAATNIAKWNGSSWNALGSGMNGDGVALAVSGTDLYTGGDFRTAGGKVSAYIARAYLPTLPTVSASRSGPNVTISWPSVDTDGFGLEQADMLSPPISWVTNAASVTDDGTNKSVTLPPTNSPQFFRLRRP